MKKDIRQSKTTKELSSMSDLNFLESYKEKILEQCELIKNAETEIIDDLYLQCKVQDTLINIKTPRDAVHVAKIANENGFDGSIFYNTVENISHSKMTQLSKQLEIISDLIEHLKKEYTDK